MDNDPFGVIDLDVCDVELFLADAKRFKSVSVQYDPKTIETHGHPCCLVSGKKSRVRLFLSRHYSDEKDWLENEFELFFEVKKPK